jgi:hypothetical protein
MSVFRKFVELSNDMHDSVWYFAYGIRQKVARVLLDTELGKAIITEWFFREHLQRARDLDCGVYCIYHACDAKKCPDDGAHDYSEDEELQAN